MSGDAPARTDPRLWRLHQVATFYSRHALDAVGRHVREELHYTMGRELLYRVSRSLVFLCERPWAAFRLHEASKSVASILPMSREMADLHLLDAPLVPRRAEDAGHMLCCALPSTVPPCSSNDIISSPASKSSGWRAGCGG